MIDETFLSIEQLNTIQKQLNYFNDVFFDEKVLYAKHEQNCDAMDSSIAERIFILKNDYEKVGDCFKNEKNILKNNFYSIEKEPIEIDMVLSSYRLYSADSIKKEYKQMYERIVDLTLAIQKPLFQHIGQDGLRMDLCLNQNLELQINIEAKLNNQTRIINATSNKERIFDEIYWRKILYKLYKLESFFEFNDFKCMSITTIEDHLSLLDY